MAAEASPRHGLGQGMSAWDPSQNPSPTFHHATMALMLKGLKRDRNESGSDRLLFICQEEEK
jgi:hypothetical protein